MHCLLPCTVGYHALLTIMHRLLTHVQGARRHTHPPDRGTSCREQEQMPTGGPVVEAPAWLHPMISRCRKPPPRRKLRSARPQQKTNERRPSITKTKQARAEPRAAADAPAWLHLMISRCRKPPPRRKLRSARPQQKTNERRPSITKTKQARAEPRAAADGTAEPRTEHPSHRAAETSPRVRVGRAYYHAPLATMHCLAPCTAYYHALSTAMHRLLPSAAYYHDR